MNTDLLIGPVQPGIPAQKVWVFHFAKGIFDFVLGSIGGNYLFISPLVIICKQYWFWPFAKQIYRILKPEGSFVLDIGGSWNKGEPTRSLYHFELLIRLCGDRGLFKLAQEFYWYNRAKMPAPAQWVTIERVRVKDAIQPIWWLAKTAYPKACNKRVLKPYSESMKNLLKKGYNDGPRPSGHVVSKKWGEDHGGAIPPNVIEVSNTKSSDSYLRACREYGLEVYPARFTDKVPEFFIKFLTKPRNLVLDPFAGSNVVGYVAE